MEDCAVEYSELESLIENYVTQYYTEFIMGKQDINDDTYWKEYINELYECGLERYIELVRLYIGADDM